MAFTTGISVEEGEGNRGGHGGMMLLATGGEDGILRVWELSADRSESYYIKFVLLYIPKGAIFL